MKKTLIPTLVCLLAIAFSQAQSNDPAAQSNTLESQFSDVIDKSNSYEDYKVVKKYKLNQLKKSVLDSVANFQSEIQGLNSTINQQRGEISGLNNKLTETETQLTASRSREDGISLFGMMLKKSAYNAILWTLIGLMVVLLLVFVSKYRSSNRITKEAREKLAETEMEFEGFRQRSLEREQQIRRKLQDEINKNKKTGV